MKKLLIISILFLVSLGGIAQKYHWPLNEWSTLPGVALTSGTVTTGLLYEIGLFVAGDDFTNIGGVNTSGTSFVATGTTPTTWTNSSILRQVNFYSQEVETGILGTGSYIHTVMDGSASGRREFELDGTSDYLEITDAALGEGGDFGTADFSVQVKFDPFNVTDQNKYLINKEAGGVGWGIQQYEDDVKIRFDDNTTDPSAIISTAVLTAGTLVDVIVVFDRDANATCYIDGVASGTVDISSSNLTLSNAGALRLGTETGGTTNEFKGDLYNAKLFNYALSQAQIDSLIQPEYMVEEVDRGADNSYLYESDFTSDNGYSPTGGAIANSVTKDGEVNCLEFTLSGGAIAHRIQKSISFEAGKKYRLTGKIWIESTGIPEVFYTITDPANELGGTTTTDTWVDISGITPAVVTGETVVRFYTAANDYDGKRFWLKDIKLQELGNTLDLGPEGMFENIWYDWEHDISGTVTGATLQIPSASNLGATVFDGADSKILALTDAQFDGTGDMTITCWVENRSFGEGGRGTILTDGTFAFWASDKDDENRYAFSSIDLLHKTNSADNSCILNAKQFVAITRDAAGLVSFYIGDNGNAPALSKTADQDSGTPVDGEDLFIGNITSQTRTFDGRIWDIKIWKSLLSEDQILKEYNDTKK